MTIHKTHKLLSPVSINLGHLLQKVLKANQVGNTQSTTMFKISDRSN